MKDSHAVSLASRAFSIGRPHLLVQELVEGLPQNILQLEAFAHSVLRRGGTRSCVFEFKTYEVSLLVAEVFY